MSTDPYKTNILSDTQNHIPNTKTKPNDNKTKPTTFIRINSISERKSDKNHQETPTEIDHDSS